MHVTLWYMNETAWQKGVASEAYMDDFEPPGREFYVKAAEYEGDVETPIQAAKLAYHYTNTEQFDGGFMVGSKAVNYKGGDDRVHSSMSPGDIVQAGDTWLLVEPIGFREIEPLAKRVK